MQSARLALLRHRNHHVQFAGFQAGEHLAGREIRHFHLRPGMGLAEIRDGRRHQTLGQRGRVADPQPPAGARGLHPLDCLFGLTQHFARLAQHCLTRRRQPDRVRPALEQALANLLLQRLDLPAERGLCEENLLRGAADIAGLGDGDEVTQLAEFHMPEPYQKVWLRQRTRH